MVHIVAMETKSDFVPCSVSTDSETVELISPFHPLRRCENSVSVTCQQKDSAYINVVRSEFVSHSDSNDSEIIPYKHIQPGENNVPETASTVNVSCQQKDNADNSVVSFDDSDDTLLDPNFELPSSLSSDTDEYTDMESIESDEEAVCDEQPDEPDSSVGDDLLAVNLPVECANKDECHTTDSENGDRMPARCLSLFSKKPVTTGCKQVYDKTHLCTFCGTSIRNKMSRHLLSVHMDEEAVKEILLLPKRSAQRRYLLQKHVNDGNFKHNIASVQKGKGNIVVARRSLLTNRSTSDFTACEFCKKWMSKKNLWRHTKVCLVRKEYYRSHPDESDKKKQRVAAVRRGQALVNNAAFDKKGNSLNELISRMRDDEVKQIVVSDELICREAGLRMCGIGRKVDQKQDDIYRVSQTARMLGRIVLVARQTIPDVSLDSLIHPQNFDLIVDIAKKLSTDKDQPALNVGRTIGNILGKVCTSKYCAALRVENRIAQQDATNVKKLIESEWNNRVNRGAVRRMQKEKRSKVHPIPLTQDLQLFREYLLRNIHTTSAELQAHHRPEDWVLLAKLVLSRLILFNKRRRSEVRELKVEEYLARPNWKDDDGGEMDLALSQTDRLLAER